MYEVTKEFNFEAGHCLDGHPGKCKNAHGHNYKILVTLGANTLNNMDMVMDFYDLNTMAKDLFNQFDHAFVYNTFCVDPFEKELAGVIEKYDRKIMKFSHRATAENMSRYFYEEISKLLQDSSNSVTVKKVTVYETPTSYATYYEENK